MSHLVWGRMHHAVCLLANTTIFVVKLFLIVEPVDRMSLNETLCQMFAIKFDETSFTLFNSFHDIFGKVFTAQCEHYVRNHFSTRVCRRKLSCRHDFFMVSPLFFHPWAKSTQEHYSLSYYSTFVNGLLQYRQCRRLQKIFYGFRFLELFL